MSDKLEKIAVIFLLLGIICVLLAFWWEVLLIGFVGCIIASILCIVLILVIDVFS